MQQLSWRKESLRGNESPRSRTSPTQKETAPASHPATLLCSYSHISTAELSYSRPNQIFWRQSLYRVPNWPLNLRRSNELLELRAPRRILRLWSQCPEKYQPSLWTLSILPQQEMWSRTTMCILRWNWNWLYRSPRKGKGAGNRVKRACANCRKDKLHCAERWVNFSGVLPSIFWAWESQASLCFVYETRPWVCRDAIIWAQQRDWPNRRCRGRL